MSFLPAALAPIAVQHSDVLVLDALTRYVAQSGMQIVERLPPERVLASLHAVSRDAGREARKRVATLTPRARRTGSSTLLT